MESELGPLISVLNPYANPKCEPFDPATPLRRMQPPYGAAGWTAASAAIDPIAHIPVQMDNYQGGEWTFMGQTYKISRSLLIPYRYQVLGGKDRDKPTGVWALGQLLVGYVGGDGGG